MNASRHGGLAWAFAFLATAAAPGSEAAPPAETYLEGAALTSDCPDPTPTSPLTLQAATNRAMCASPRGRGAWFAARSRAAAIGIARATYLPTLGLQVQRRRDDTTTLVAERPELNSHVAGYALSQSLSLAWVLYDFGTRESALSNAEWLFAAAQANSDATLQALFTDVVNTYRKAQATAELARAAQNIEDLAKETLEVVQQRVDARVAPIADLLQAQTQYMQATIARAKAERDLALAQGVLASLMSLREDFSPILPAIGESLRKEDLLDDEGPVRELLDEVKRKHPLVLIAQSNWEAAKAGVEQAKAEGLPSLHLTGRGGSNRQPVTSGLGQPQYQSRGRDWSIGVLLNVPLFEGNAQEYRVIQAQAEAEARAADLDSKKEEVGLQVWQATTNLRSARRVVDHAERLVSTAESGYEAALERYRMGVGSVLELLTSQGALSNARKERVNAVWDLLAGKTDLARALGRLGMWSSDRP